VTDIYRAVKLTDKVFWVGAIDWTIRDFHGYKTPRGSTYNAADRMIANAVKANLLLEVGERLVNGHRAMCYRRK